MAKKVSMLSHLETFGLVTLITILIWLYAEGQTLTSSQMDLTISFVGPTGSSLLIEPRVQSDVRVSYRCPTSRIAQAEAFGRRGTVQIVVDVKPGETVSEQVVNFKTWLNDFDTLRRMGVTVDSVEPEGASVMVQRLVPVTLPVRVDPGAGDTVFVGRPEPAVKQATVQLPAQFAAEHDLEGVELLVPLGSVDMRAFEPNRDSTVSLDITLPPDLREQLPRITPQITPARTNVTFRLRRKGAETVITTVPVLAVVSPTYMGQYEINLNDADRTLGDVKVTGPAEAIERINAGQTRVFATFRVTADQLANPEPQTAELTLLAPEGVKPDPLLPSVRFTVKPLTPLPKTVPIEPISPAPDTSDTSGTAEP